MRAYVVTAPRTGAVQEVPAPVAGPGEVVVDVHRVGVCGTDTEFWTGEMPYLHDGHARYPMRLGHEWCGVVSSVGPGAGQWQGRRVTGDTMIGCGHCERCRAGRHNVCGARAEIGIRDGFAGALAEQLLVPVRCLLALPDSVDDTAGALVEPGGNAVRALRAAGLATGDRLLVLGTGTIGLLVADLARAAGIEVHVLGRTTDTVRFARTRGLSGVWLREELPDLAWDAVVDASNAVELPALAVELVEPGRRVVLIGLAGQPSRIDTRSLVFADVTAVGILAGSAGLATAIEHYAAGDVDPRPLVAGTVGLDRVGDVLAGAVVGEGPKTHVDPRMSS